MIAAASEGNPVIGGLMVAVAVVVVLCVLARDRRRAPNLPCRRCRGRGVRSSFRSDASGPCPHCGGKSRQRRI